MLVTLTIAGSDSIGGAGIEADIKALASQGVHGAVALTAVTSQNSTRVSSVFPLPPPEVVRQIDAVLEDVHVSSAKTGMLYSADIASSVAARLKGEDIPLVIDPVLVAGVGDGLSREGLVEVLLDRLIPISTVLTPNIPEAESLVGFPLVDEDGVRKACRHLADLGAEAVLIKGGHMDTATCVDILYHNDRFVRMEGERVPARGHGGGCILSSYIAANLAKGMGTWEAVQRSKETVDESIAARYRIGKGIPMVEPLGLKIRDGQKYHVARRLRDAARKLPSMMPLDWYHEGGSDMVFALPEASGPQEVCGLEPLIGDAQWSGCVSFHNGHYPTMDVLTVMRHDEGMRAAMDLRSDKKIITAFRREGMSVVTVGPPHGCSSQDRPSGMEDAIILLGFVPDVVNHLDGPNGAVVRLFGSSPEVLLSKLSGAVR